MKLTTLSQKDKTILERLNTGEKILYLLAFTNWRGVEIMKIINTSASYVSNVKRATLTTIEDIRNERNSEEVIAKIKYIMREINKERTNKKKN